MILRCFLCSVLALIPLAESAAQEKEPPIRLQKKGKTPTPVPSAEDLEKQPLVEEKPKTVEQKLERSSLEKNLITDELQDAEATLNEVTKTMRSVEEKLGRSLAELNLSVRATNCLESEGINTVRDLVGRTEEQLLQVRNFGETTLQEVKDRLGAISLRLGMRIPQSSRSK